MLVGIASGTYSSIFIASPVLTAWKEREPGFARRRARIAEVDGTVPAFADEVTLARLGEEESDAEIEEELAAVTVGEPPGGNGGDPEKESAERRERNARRRERRQKRRKHGRNR
jgi:SecD/SecF fusion protein